MTLAARTAFNPILIAGGLMALALLGLAVFHWQNEEPEAPIRIGVLHSLSGTMAVSEMPMVTAAQMAADEINAAGGLLGRTVEIVVADSRSDPLVAASEAERLIAQEQVSVIFGCWTSACRKAVKPVIEKHKHLLFYPVQYEGLEQSPNIIYTGAAPNQQIVPGVRWATEQFGQRVYLIGSDYVFPRTANLIIRDFIAAHGGKVVGERYLPLASRDVGALVEDIKRSEPDVVLNTINGDSNGAFFETLSSAGLASLPLVSFSVAEPEMQAWHGGQLQQHYAVWSYFQSLATPRNLRFVADFQKKFVQPPLVSDPIETTYTGVKLWANAVREIGVTDPELVDADLLHQSIEAPHGIAAIDAATRHMWRQVRVGQVQADGQFKQVYVSPEYVRPAPWPTYRGREEWQALTGTAR